MTLADAIAPGSGHGRLHFPDETTSLDYGELWTAGEAIGCLRAATDGKPVMVILTNTRACAAVLVGAIAVGQPLVSVPLPPRGADLAWYGQFVWRINAISGAGTLLVDTSLLSLIPPVDGLTVMSFDDALALRGPSTADPASFTLTQFTSGSTADPKGIVLSGDKVAANLEAIMTWIQPDADFCTCSWLPLSHDMGLLGMFLAPLVAMTDRWARSGKLVIMAPTTFLRRPASWLTACEEFQATLTAGSNYSYDMAARRRGAAHDLRSLRICIVGSEPISAGTLERFTEVFRDTGFDPRAFSPGYGMAEAGLAVTATPRGTHWTALELASLVADSDREIDAAGEHRVVSSGIALPGYEVRVDGTGLGEVLVRGPSIATSYADGTPLVDADGWYHTRDLGAVRDGGCYVLGRTDDVFQVAGRNIYAVDVEAHAAEVTGVRRGRVVAVPDNGGLTLVAECDPSISDRASTARVAQALRQQIVSRLGTAPHRVLLARRGALPVTASGKIRRKPLIAALRSAELEILTGSIE
ncbi:AMP-binding protein [Phytohabitans suffuscus]|uniref:Putative acyl-CoA synthase/polyketide synthase n=1 Tax=Phytohabitans suffuscus TaxID=624315 RepID=A0A6F8YS28_9ACTN|nr:AMP-binding protein [Phytohabitans suffuscus]BCB88641.1 putative acyl-CoA synthase/polyketide synthase [Phytohabitans suffuscus]